MLVYMVYICLKYVLHLKKLIYTILNFRLLAEFVFVLLNNGKKRRVLVGFWTWVVTGTHMGCTTVVVNVCRHSPSRELAVWCVTSVPPKCILTEFSGIAPITYSCSRTSSLTHFILEKICSKQNSNKFCYF